MIRRRTFLAGTAALLAAPPVVGQSLPQMVVIGGGAGGASFARRLANAGEGQIEITLIEPARLYHPAFLSNHTLAGVDAPAAAGHGYGALTRTYGITVIHDWALPVDPFKREVALSSGGAIGWDRLVLAPGIEFQEGALPGWDLTWQGAMPHAWRGGVQVRMLRDQLAAMPEGGTFCIIAPRGPSRGAFAVHERVAAAAQLLVETNPTAKILLVDAEEEPPLLPVFAAAWERHAPGMVERVVPETVEVRPETMEVVLDDDVLAVDVCNAIPAQVAGRLAQGLVDGSGFVPVSPWNLQWEADPAIQVIGDAVHISGLPRSAAIAQAQARAAAEAVLSELTEAFTNPPDYSDPAWPLIGPGEAAHHFARFEPAEEDADPVTQVEQDASLPDDPAEVFDHNFRQSLAWYDATIEGMLGAYTPPEPGGTGGP